MGSRNTKTCKEEDFHEGNVDFRPLSADHILTGSVAKYTVKLQNIEQPLLNFLLDDTWLSKTDEELLNAGFYDTSNPRPHLHYMEGYFHGEKQSGSIRSLKPRNGESMEKPSAPVKIRAFIQAIKEKNRAIFNKLTECIPEKLAMRRLLEGDKALTDLVIQLNYGGPVLEDNIRYHVDTFNSMIHMGVSLAGERAFYTKHVKEDGDIIDYSSIQSPGVVYMSSPTAYKHGTGHKKITREDRVVAIMCRVLMTPEEYGDISRQKEEHESCLDSIAAVMKETEFILPTLEEVTKVMEEIHSN